VSHAGFPPVATPAARVLVLGSLPGAESLRRREYYAQPRNAFWTILGAIAGAGPGLPYTARLARLDAARIALWDVCAAARRVGSLDADIERDSIVSNDFAAFLGAHQAIGTVLFNGRTAAALYRRHVLPGLPPRARSLTLVELPSTSPAHAAMSLAVKTERWRHAVTHAIGGDPA